MSIEVSPGGPVHDQVSLGGGISIAYWTVDEGAVGRRLEELDFRGRWHSDVIGVQRGAAQAIDILPAAAYVLRKGDVALLIGTDARLHAFTR